MSAAEKEAALYKFDKPVKEKKITQEMRQIAFDNYETTDDHGMVIVGTAVDQQGNPFFKVKNSWDVRPPYDGYYYFSRPFVEYKTLSIMVNKNAVPQEKDLSAYLMVFHKDETHGLYMALSRDGYTFTALNDGEPVLAGDTIAYQRGIRDPYIYRGPDGAFYWP